MLFSLKRKTNRHPFFAFHRLAKGGADLIDILISTFLILGILAAVFAAAGTYRHIRNSRLDSIATKVASSDIENIRKLSFAEIPGSATLSPNDYPDITKLPNGSVTRTVIPYTPPGCTACNSTDGKKVSLLVSWTEKGAARQIALDTMIYKYGIIKK